MMYTSGVFGRPAPIAAFSTARYSSGACSFAIGCAPEAAATILSAKNHENRP
jgi:hypothetical protein